MVAAMGGFAVEDMLLKTAAETLPVGLVMIWFGLAGAVVFAAIAGVTRQPLFPREARGRTMIVRTVFEIAGRLFYTLALALTPLSSATAILQATPVFVVAGAALILGDRVGWRRWAAIGAGLVGVLVILRPGAEAFSPLSILAVLGMLGFAGRDLATRAAPPALGTWALGAFGFGAIVAAGLLFSTWDGTAMVQPGSREAALLGAATLVGVSAYSALTLAMRTGEVAAVTPFRYTRLLFGIGLGVLVFGERPDHPVYLGSLIVVASGLYILARGRHQLRPPR